MLQSLHPSQKRFPLHRQATELTDPYGLRAKNIAHPSAGERKNITVRKVVQAELFGKPFCSGGPIWGKAAV